MEARTLNFNKSFDSINSAIDTYIEDLSKRLNFQWIHFQSGKKSFLTKLWCKLHILNVIWNNITSIAFLRKLEHLIILVSKLIRKWFHQKKTQEMLTLTLHKKRIFVLRKFVKRTEKIMFSLVFVYFRFTEISYFLNFPSNANVRKQHLSASAHAHSCVNMKFSW